MPINSDHAIAEASQSLLQLLMKEVGAGQIVLLSPHEKIRSEPAKLLLMMYHITVNANLGNQQTLSTSSGDVLAVEPLYVDLHYLLSVSSQSDDNSEVEKEQQLLGQAMRVLYDHPVLMASQLKGSLAQTRDGLQVRYEPLPAAELNGIWSAVAMQPMIPAIHYVVTPVPLYSSRTLPVKRVTQKINRYAKMETWS